MAQPPNTQNIEHKEEFKAFLKILEQEGQLSHWVDVAKVLGVHQNTITNWKQTKEAREATARGIANALKKMETAGAKDWRMWEAKLKLLGLNPPEKHEIIGDPIKEILKGYGLVDAGEATSTEETTPQDTV